jgi:phosphoglycerate dehydrogenase-like enzyme
MRLLIQQASYDRIRPALDAIDLPVEPLVADGKGVVTEGARALDRGEIAPEVVWLSLDALFGGGFALFTDVALNDRSVKWVQTAIAGLDMPIVRQIFDRGVRLSNSSAQGVAIAEYVIGQVFAEHYPTRAYREAQANREWKRVGFSEIAETTWLIVGYGNIGREIAKRIKAFGASVVGVRRAAAPDEFADAVITQAELPAHLPQADVVVLACGLNESTRNLANAAFFAAMKPKAVLVNIGRGGCVDEEALLAALEGPAPGLAILDVFKKEPLPADSPFWTHPKVRVSAHTSPASRGTVARGDRLFLDNLKRYAAGAPLLNEVTARSF